MRDKTIPGSHSLTSKSYCMAKVMLGRTVQGGYKIMGAVSSKKPCDRGGQNSTVQALPKKRFLIR